MSGTNTPATPSPSASPHVTVMPTVVEDLPAIELEPTYDAVVRIREHDSGGGLIQLEFNRALTKQESDDIKRLQAKHNITVSETSIQYGCVYDGRQVARQLEKILRRRKFDRLQFYIETPGQSPQKLSTLL